MSDERYREAESDVESDVDQTAEHRSAFRAPVSYRREDLDAPQDDASPAEDVPANAVEVGDAGTRTLGDADGTAWDRPQGPRRADETLVSPVSPVARGRASDAGQPYPQVQARQPLRRQGGAYGVRRPSPQRPALAPRGYADGDDRGGYTRPEDRGLTPRDGGRDRARGRRVGRTVLLVLAWAFRLAAIGLAVLVVVDVFTIGNRMTLMQLTATAARLLPGSLAGLYVLDTPFGGAFRGDFAIASVALFVLDWVCMRVRHALR